MKFVTAVMVLFTFLPWAGAQIKPLANSPVHWQFSIKKQDGDNYRFEAKATLDNGYHIWAQDPGGDGSLIPTSFTTEALQDGAWAGDWKESKPAQNKKFEFIDGEVHFHEKEIIFYRDFKGKRGDKIEGAVQYQSCNDQMCLPPTIENFMVLVN